MNMKRETDRRGKRVRGRDKERWEILGTYRDKGVRSQRERERETDRQTDRETETEKDRERQKEKLFLKGSVQDFEGVSVPLRYVYMFSWFYLCTQKS